MPVMALRPVPSRPLRTTRRPIVIDCYSNRIDAAESEARASPHMISLYDELVWRGLVYDATEGLAERFARERVTAYIGFDPTASSLHVGSLLTVMVLARLQRSGHVPIAIVGGGTGMIGDPSGKSLERVLLTAQQIDVNVAGIRTQLERFLDFGDAPNAARIVNNADWLGTIDLLSFLRDAGKHFTVNYMLQKESVSR